MKSISLISVYNNVEKMREMVDSAKKQCDVNIDYVLLDNTDFKFKSAAKALNYGIKKAVGEVVVFLHQDIIFLDPNQLSLIFDFAVENKNVIFGAAGVKSKAGPPPRDSSILSSMYGGKGKNKYNTADKPTTCFTLDECLIACHRECLTNLSFDEVNCDGWHLYGADLCLQANLDPKLCVMVIPMNVWHKSNGNADRSYYKTQNKLAKKYYKKYKIINSTNGFAYTNPIKRLFSNIYRAIRY